MSTTIFHRRRPEVGAAPGTFAARDAGTPSRVSLLSFGRDALEEHDDLDPSEVRSRLVPGRVNWIDVQGFGDGSAVRELGAAWGLHPLALADVVNHGQRPKVEEYDGVLFVTLQMVTIDASGAHRWEQVSLFLCPDAVITFQEAPGDCLETLRERIRAGRKRVRSSGHDFLATMVVDAIVDGYFPVLEELGEDLERLEDEVLANPERESLAAIYRVKRDLILLRRASWPLRDALSSLLRDDSELVGKEARTYVRDTVDHLAQAVEVGEMYRELCVGLVDVYLSIVGQKTNEVMRVLTVIATLFIPLTFVAGVYGMNFDTRRPANMPELAWDYGYLFFWGLCLAMVTGLLFVFRRMGWLGGGKS